MNDQNQSTPRTDKHIEENADTHAGVYVGPHVHPQFARQLERELTAANQDLAGANGRISLLRTTIEVVEATAESYKRQLQAANQALAESQQREAGLREALSNIETWASCAMTAPEAQAAIEGFEQIRDEAAKALTSPTTSVVPWEVRIVSPTVNDPFRQLECKVIDVGHADKRLVVEMPDEAFGVPQQKEKQV